MNGKKNGYKMNTTSKIHIYFIQGSKHSKQLGLTCFLALKKDLMNFLKGSHTSCHINAKNVKETPHVLHILKPSLISYMK